LAAAKCKQVFSLTSSLLINYFPFRLKIVFMADKQPFFAQQCSIVPF